MDLQAKSDEFFDYFRENTAFGIDFENYAYEIERYVPITIHEVDTKFRIVINETHQMREASLDVFDEDSETWVIVPTLLNLPPERQEIFNRVVNNLVRKIP